MHRIDAPGATPDNRFTEGDPSQGIEATDVSADFLNAVQEEIASVIEGAGITLNKASNSQLLLALQSLLMPTATVIHVATATAPAGFLKANGAAVSRSTYANLFAKIGTTYGAGDGSTTFNLPDLRGEFIRSLDDGRNVDVGRAIGSAQAGQNASHTHTGTTASNGAHTHTYDIAFTDTSRTYTMPDGGSAQDYGDGTTHSSGAHTHTFTTAASGGTETRPRNVALLACIKF